MSRRFQGPENWPQRHDGTRSGTLGYKAVMAAHRLNKDGKKVGVTGLLNTGAVVSVMPIKAWERIGFTREDLI